MTNITSLEIRNYVRDYQRYEEALSATGKCTQNKMATAMGMSVQQVVRYRNIQLLIPELQELVYDKTIGLSSAQPISTHCHSEQHEIYRILKEALEDHCKLTRICVKQIVFEYRNGKKSWHDIKSACDIAARESKEPAQVQLPGSLEKKHAASILVDIASLSGKEFVFWFAALLEKLGYTGVSVTDSSYDQGADLLAQKDGLKYCFQCKHHKDTVSISAFQEVYYGKPADCNVAVVVASGRIAKNAIRSGAKRGIQAWDGSTLTRLVKSVTTI